VYINYTMKASILISLVASAAAFAPAQQQAVRSSAVGAFANGYVGGEGPEPMFIGKEGSKNFDPAGLAEVRIMVAYTQTNKERQRIKSKLAFSC
jgi:hypothetical protein